MTDQAPDAVVTFRTRVWQETLAGLVFRVSRSSAHAVANGGRERCDQEARMLMALAFAAHGFSGPETARWLGKSNHSTVYGARDRAKRLGRDYRLSTGGTLEEAINEIERKVRQLGCVPGQYPTWLQPKEGTDAR